MIKPAIAVLLALLLSKNEKRTAVREERDRKVNIKDSYDFIVVGAGTTGSVIASRLAEAEGVSVLVLEAGQSGRKDLLIQIPNFAPGLIGSKRDWGISTTAQEKLQSKTGLRGIVYPRGKVGGGSSALNYNVWIRGHEYDYKLWEDEGATAWNLDNLRKYFNKIEHATEEGMSESIGIDGQLKLAKNFDNPLSNIINNAASQIGIPIVDYLDGGGLKEGMGNITKSVVNGRRQYSLNSYLWPTRENRKSSLDIAFDAHAYKILFRELDDGSKEAYGVRFNHSGVVRNVLASKEVIVSCGSFNSPQLLMLSGVGPRQHLEDFGIDIVADVPGVGQNAEDHPALPLYFHSDGFPPEYLMTTDKVKNTYREYKRFRSGPMSTAFLFTNVGNIQVEMENPDATLSSPKYPFPDLNIHVVGYSAVTEDFVDIDQVFQGEVDAANVDRNGVLYHFSIWPIIAHPLSRGTVTLQSSDPQDLPLYDGKYFENENDFKLMLEGIRKIENMEQSPEFKKHRIRLAMFPDHCNTPRNSSIPRSEEFYRCYLGQMGGSFYHATSTCKIGFKNDTMAVVDHRLRLHAARNVRVADASVMPHVTTANTQASCYVIGEKAADMIKEEWGLQQHI